MGNGYAMGGTSVVNGTDPRESTHKHSGKSACKHQQQWKSENPKNENGRERVENPAKLIHLLIISYTICLFIFDYTNIVKWLNVGERSMMLLAWVWEGNVLAARESAPLLPGCSTHNDSCCWWWRFDEAQVLFSHNHTLLFVQWWRSKRERMVEACLMMCNATLLIQPIQPACPARATSAAAVFARTMKNSRVFNQQLNQQQERVDVVYTEHRN